MPTDVWPAYSRVAAAELPLHGQRWVLSSALQPLVDLSVPPAAAATAAHNVLRRRGCRPTDAAAAAASNGAPPQGVQLRPLDGSASLLRLADVQLQLPGSGTTLIEGLDLEVGAARAPADV